MGPWWRPQAARPSQYYPGSTRMEDAMRITECRSEMIEPGGGLPRAGQRNRVPGQNPQKSNEAVFAGGICSQYERTLRLSFSDHEPSNLVSGPHSAAQHGNER